MVFMLGSFSLSPVLILMIYFTEERIPFYLSSFSQDKNDIKQYFKKHRTGVTCVRRDWLRLFSCFQWNKMRFHIRICCRCESRSQFLSRPILYSSGLRRFSSEWISRSSRRKRTAAIRRRRRARPINPHSWPSSAVSPNWKTTGYW